MTGNESTRHLVTVKHQPRPDDQPERKIQKKNSCTPRICQSSPLQNGRAPGLPCPVYGVDEAGNRWAGLVGGWRRVLIWRVLARRSKCTSKSRCHSTITTTSQLLPFPQQQSRTVPPPPLPQPQPPIDGKTASAHAPPHGHQFVRIAGEDRSGSAVYPRNRLTCVREIMSAEGARADKEDFPEPPPAPGPRDLS